MTVPVPPSQPTRQTGRQPWSDRWLLDAFLQIGHPAAAAVTSGHASAWDALEAAGAEPNQILAVVCDLAGATAAQLDDVGPEQASLLAEPLAQRYNVVPVQFGRDRILEVATPDPLGRQLERDLSFASGRRVRVTIASPGAVHEARSRVYGEASAPLVPRKSSAVKTPAAAAPVQGPRLQWVVEGARNASPIAPTRGAAVDQLDGIIADALDQRASDVHFEPKDADMLVRFRVDGVLHDVTRVTGAVAPLLMSRIKVTAGLDIADRLRPQDGRASVQFDGRSVDLRVSTLPLGNRFEKAVIRILDAAAAATGLDTLGFTPSERHRLDQMLASTEGMVLVTGPTGSGKTTTLYSILRHVQSRETNVVTVEDPVEYRLEGVSQVQVNEKSGLTFASALRSILRQDPDVVLVGEIRDGETAGIAIKAAMTGHLVLSTLHTNDAPSAVSRLADVGADVGALSGALKGVLAQRLVRRLCKECSVPVALATLPVDQQQLLAGRATAALRAPVGCPACRGTGYRGRMVVVEVMTVNADMQRAIARGAAVTELRDLAARGGMKALWEAGLDRVLTGSTSLHELLDNVAAPIHESGESQADIDALLATLLGGAARGGPPTGKVPQVADDTVSNSRRTVPPSPTVASTEVHQPRVLVVHDDLRTRRTWRAALESAGHAVLEAADGASALAYARRLRPDALVIEVAIPVLDAVGLLQALAAEGLTVPVLICTEQGDCALHDWLRELGAADVVDARDPAALAPAVGLSVRHLASSRSPG